MFVQGGRHSTKQPVKSTLLFIYIFIICCVCTGWSPLHEAECKNYLAIHLYLYIMLCCQGGRHSTKQPAKATLLFIYIFIICCVCTGWSRLHEAACKVYLTVHIYLYNMLCCQGGRHSTKQPAKATLLFIYIFIICCVVRVVATPRSSLQRLPCCSYISL